MIEPTKSGPKWIARLDDRILCVAAAPFVTSARILLAGGYPADTVIEMWRPNTAAWALRGRLGAVAATLLDGETALRCAKNGPPVRKQSGPIRPLPTARQRQRERVATGCDQKSNRLDLVRQDDKILRRAHSDMPAERAVRRAGLRQSDGFGSIEVANLHSLPSTRRAVSAHRPVPSHNRISSSTSWQENYEFTYERINSLV
ncbi:MAG: hypothetical protein ACRECV_19765 [Xanthobacteraceae bacterium]